MSIKDRLAKKTADLVTDANQLSVPSSSESSLSSAGAREVRGPLTAPGQMLAFRKQMQESDSKIHELEDKLKEFKGGALIKRIDAKHIRLSKWANRHEYSFSDANFSAFKAEIEAAGGNVQPILVRKLVSQDVGYEIVFGHRRHRACLDLDLPVLAFIGELTDKELFSMMERENRQRADLSPFEQGEMYRRALDEGIFPSIRKLSAELGVDLSLVSKAMTIARLPADVLSCFESPTLIQYRWGKELSEAIQNDPVGTLSRAKELRSALRKQSARQVVDALLGKAKTGKSVIQQIKRNGEVVAKLISNINGTVDIRFAARAISPDTVIKLKNEIEKFLSDTED
jgi:ParB family transcriptional regulator, chromosome partitioning protein